MLFYKNYDAICRSRGTSANAAALAIGRSKSAASAWKRNGTLPKEDELIALAKHLNCYVSDFFRQPGEALSAYAQIMDDYPLEEPDEKLPPSREQELDDSESDFIAVYRECTKRQKSELMTLVYEFAENNGFDVEEDLR